MMRRFQVGHNLLKVMVSWTFSLCERWHAFCLIQVAFQVEDFTMDADLHSLGIDDITLHHDLLIELGKVEMAMERIQPDQETPAATQFDLLEGRRAKLNALLARLAA